MGSKSHASATLFIALNFLFFCIVTATYCPPPPCKHCTKPTPSPKPKSPPKAPKSPQTPTPTTPKTPPAPVPTTPTPSTPTPTPSTPTPSTPTPSTPTPTPSTPTPTPTTPTPTPYIPTPATPTTPTPTPTTPTPSTPPPTTPSPRSCPRDVLQLGVCGNLLDGLINVVIGSTPSNRECCSLLQGLADLDAAICLCTAIRANVLGINLNVPISLSLLLNSCDIPQPSNFQCA